MGTRLWQVVGVTDNGTTVTVEEELPINLERKEAYRAIKSRYGFKKIITGSTINKPISSSSVKTEEIKWFRNNDNDSSNKRSRDDDDDDDYSSGSISVDNLSSDSDLILQVAYLSSLVFGVVIFWWCDIWPWFSGVYGSIVFTINAVKVLFSLDSEDTLKVTFLKSLIIIPIAFVLGNKVGILISKQGAEIRLLSPVFIAISLATFWAISKYVSELIEDRKYQKIYTEKKQLKEAKKKKKKKKKEEKKLKKEMDATQKDNDDPEFMEELEKLVSLKEKGLLTEDEFNAAKAKLLN